MLSKCVLFDPIHAASMINMDLANKDIIKELQHDFGLDKPLYLQYLYWLKDFIKASDHA